MTKIVSVPQEHHDYFISVCWEINKVFNRLLSSPDPTKFPMKYSLVVCKK